MRAISLQLLLVAALGVGSCAKPEPPRVTPKSVRLATVGPGGVDVALELDVYNPNSFPLSARAVDGALLLGSGVELGRGRATPTAAIPSEGSATVASTLSIPWSNAGALMPFVMTNQPVSYKFQGNATIGGERLNVVVPFELTGELSRAELLRIGLTGLTVPVPAP